MQRRKPEVTMAYTLKMLQDVPYLTYWNASKIGDFQWTTSNDWIDKRIDLLHATAWFSVNPVMQENIRQFALWVLNAPTLGAIGAQKFRQQYDYAFSSFATKEYRNDVINRALQLQGRGPIDMKNYAEYMNNDMPPLEAQSPPPPESFMQRTLNRLVNGANGVVLDDEKDNDADDDDDEEQQNIDNDDPEIIQLNRQMANTRINNVGGGRNNARIVSRPGPEAQQRQRNGQAAHLRRQGLGGEMHHENGEEHATTAAELWDSVESKLPLPAKLLITSKLGLGVDPSSALKKLKTRDGKVDYMGAFQGKGTGQVMRSSGMGAPAYSKDKRLSREFASALLTVYTKLPQRQKKPFERLVEFVIKDLENVQSHTEKTDVNAEAASIIARLGLLNTIQTLDVSKRVQNVLASHLA